MYPDNRIMSSTVPMMLAMVTVAKSATRPFMVVIKRMKNATSTEYNKPTHAHVTQSMG